MERVLKVKVTWKVPSVLQPALAPLVRDDAFQAWQESLQTGTRRWSKAVAQELQLYRGDLPGEFRRPQMDLHTSRPDRTGLGVCCAKAQGLHSNPRICLHDNYLCVKHDRG